MKKILSTALFILLYAVGSSFSGEQETLTKADKKAITQYLKESQTNLAKAVENLSEAQWNFKPSDESWSPAEICEHILKAEPVVLKRVASIEGKNYKPDLIKDSQQKAEEMIAFIIGRSEKFQAPEHITPKGNFETAAAFISAFETRRNETRDFVKSLDLPIKAYYETFGPIGEVNGYHWLIFISAHTERHLAQLREVLAHPNFPI